MSQYLYTELSFLAVAEVIETHNSHEQDMRSCNGTVRWENPKSTNGRRHIRHGHIGLQPRCHFEICAIEFSRILERQDVRINLERICMSWWREAGRIVITSTCVISCVRIPVRQPGTAS
jgi:hypothetical protein